MDPTSVWKWPALNDEGTCAVCKKATKNRCTACKTVFYCNTDHQKLHWKSEHKKNCGVIELVDDPQVGRCYIAKRRIEPGEIVLREKGPLVIFINGIDYPICMNCYDDLRSEREIICNKCGWWRLCSKCKKHGSECEFTIKYGMYKDLPDKGKLAGKDLKSQHLMIGVIRALALRESNPKAYAGFMRHEDHCAQPKAYLDVLDMGVTKLVREYFNVKNVEDAEITKINRILLISGFSYRDTFSYFAEKTSYFEHNCRPNCSKTIPNKDGTFVVWAVEAIDPGEHVSICYRDGDMGTMIRKDWLSCRHFFDCACSRCEDPTEFGTMFNAVKCGQKGCDGDALPPTFAVSGGAYQDFVCRKCKVAIPWKTVAEMQEIVGIMLSAIPSGDGDSYKRFIEDHAHMLHKNHFYMIKAKLELADVLGFDAYDTPDVKIVPKKELNAKIQLSEEILELHKLLMPGHTRCRGRLLYGLAIALNEKYRRENHGISELNIGMKKWRHAVEETCKLLCYEPPESEEGQMARQAMLLYSLIPQGLYC